LSEGGNLNLGARVGDRREAIIDVRAWGWVGGKVAEEEEVIY